MGRGMAGWVGKGGCMNGQMGRRMDSYTDQLSVLHLVNSQYVQSILHPIIILHKESNIKQLTPITNNAKPCLNNMYLQKQ